MKLHWNPHASHVSAKCSRALRKSESPIQQTRVLLSLYGSLAKNGWRSSFFPAIHAAQFDWMLLSKIIVSNSVDWVS